MAIQTIHHEGDSAADPSALWALLADTMLWPEWTPIERAEIQERGDPSGIGEIRTFTTGRVTVQERVAEKVPLRRYVYVLLGGLAVRDYRAEIDLHEGVGGGTHVSWHTTFTPRFFGTGGLYRRPLDKATHAFVAGLVRAAEQRDEKA